MIRTLATGFTAGAVALHYQAELPPLAPLVWTVGVAGCAVSMAARRLRREAVHALWLGFAVAAGFTWTLACASVRLADRLDPDLDEQVVQVVGVVRGLPHALEARAGQGLRFDFEVETVDDHAVLHRPMLTSASWYPPQRKGVADPPPPFEPGQRWSLPVRLRKPHGSLNPDGFDYEGWLFERGFVATALLRGEARLLVGQDDRSLSSRIDRVRFEVQRRIVAALGERPFAGVIVALVIGEQHAITSDEWTLFGRTAIQHLVSISGLHITMLAAIGAWACTLAWRCVVRAGWLGESAPSQPVCSALGGLLVAVAYTALAGFGIPAERTLAMLAVVVAARVLARDARAFHVLSLALLVVVAFDPWSVRAPGFWLSFLAVACLLYTDRPAAVAQRRRWIDRGRDAFMTATRAQLAVTIGLIPVTLLAFHQVSLVGPLANAVAIPLVSYIVTPLALLGAAFDSQALLRGSLAAFDALAVWLQWLAALPHARLDWPPPEPHAVVLALAGLAWLAAPRAVPARLAGLACCLPLFLPLRTAPTPGQAVAVVFDVGQGSAVVVTTATHRLIYDTGPRYGDGSDAGRRVLLPWLQARGAGAIDAMVVSHDDADHAGGARSLLGEIQVDWLLASDHLDRHVQDGTLREDCKVGLHWEWDGVDFRTFAPDDDAALARKANARSCVLRIATGSQMLLLTGDIESAQEKTMLQSGTDLAATTVTIPHHGSASSSSMPWVEAVSPRIAIAQTGWRNAFGHPRPDVVERYRRVGATVLDTAQTGAITLTMTADATQARCWRREARRYWHDPAGAGCDQSSALMLFSATTRP